MDHPFKEIPVGKLGSSLPFFPTSFRCNSPNATESLTLLLQKFAEDESPVKADLMCGVYRTEEGQPYVLPSVKMAKKKIFDDPEWEHDYPPSHLGEKSFRDASINLLFGKEGDVVREKRVASMQTLGASGACHVGASFLRRFYSPLPGSPAPQSVYMPTETWVNHANVLRHNGFEPSFLPYYSPTTHSIDFSALKTAIAACPPQSIIVLQVCGNNPTGCDLDPSEWSILAEIFLTRNHFVFLDVSYMGFVTGSAAEDCAPIRLFAGKKIPLLVAATYGKAFGIYGERVGHLCITAPTPQIALKMEDQMKLLARAETGAQPRFGALVVSTILTDDELRRVWENDVGKIARRLSERRERLRERLEGLHVRGDWGYTGFTVEQVRYLREKHHVYLQDTGRISIAYVRSTARGL
ncbi:MAG: hypothetical protein Q9166_006655 [cf. Caloplaca sp. 2 TL-2023]